jgi:hypothetical protein
MLPGKFQEKTIHKLHTILTNMMKSPIINLAYELSSCLIYMLPFH